MKRKQSCRVLLILGIILWTGIHPMLSWSAPLPPGAEKSLAVPLLMDPHAGYAIEWWYLTGRITVSGESRADGFEGTFFRFETGYRHPKDLSPSPWEPKTVLSFHGAFTDRSRPTFLWTESMGRTFRRSAAVGGRPLKITLRSSRLEFHRDPHDPERFSLHLLEQVKDRVLDLTLSGQGAPLWESSTGKLVTGPGRNDWAWYFSYPSLKVSGRIGTVAHGTVEKWKPVTGVAWFDHEWTRAVLGKGQSGWIWLGGRIGKKTALMAFEMQKKGHPDRFKGGTFKQEGKSPVWLGSGDIRFRVLSTWRSPHTTICYPGQVLVTLPSQNKAFLIRPIAADQELGGVPSYWEGSVRILDPVSQKPMGEGYLELTGFPRSAPGECLQPKSGG